MFTFTEYQMIILICRERRDREEREKREREEEARKAREESERLANDAGEQERRRQKDLLLARMKAIDENKQPDSNTSPTTKKDFQFTKPVENMHHGRPAYDNVTVPVLEKARRRSLVSDSDSDGGYQPSFLKKTDKSPKKTSSKAKPKNDKKTNLMNDLFGDSSAKNSANNDNGITWGSASKKRTNPGRVRESSTTMLFAGGTGIVDSDDEAPPKSNGANLLPRRPRQQSTTFQTRPTVNAVDDFDDEIEEVVL